MSYRIRSLFLILLLFYRVFCQNRLLFLLRIVSSETRKRKEKKQSFFFKKNSNQGATDARSSGYLVLDNPEISFSKRERSGNQIILCFSSDLLAYALSDAG
jgi:hypothetical protein